MRKIGIWLCSFCLLHFAAGFTAAQQPQARPLTMNQAVEQALANYPAIRAARAQAAAAAAGVDLARTAYLPHTDLLWQENRATRNNIFGLLLPQSVIPSISGPVLGTNSLTSAWGSAAGMLFSWEPFDFGQRKAGVDVARAITNQANAGVAVTQLEVAAAAGDAFIAALAAEQAVQAATANVKRMETFAKSVHVLVANELRAGADASRADAELAAARIQLIQTQQNRELARATLAETLGVAGSTVAIDTGPLLEAAAPPPMPLPKFELHPVAQAQSAAIDIVRARARALDRSYFPRFYFQSAVSGRGTGALMNGQIDEAKGLYPQVQNWASGISITFPAFDIFAIRARRKIEVNNEAAERARYDQTMQSLRAQDARAQAVIDAARLIAQNTPVELKAARENELRARARYDAQLATVTDVAEAQRLLAQAEIDDAVARLNVWRALLAGARARGDLKPFLQQVLDTPITRREPHVDY